MLSINAAAGCSSSRAHENVGRQISSTHVPALDGTRGVAILLVLLCHYGCFPPGWTGVQIFFVLSGYLITSILLPERQLRLPEYLKRFYYRRALRIAPLLYLYVAMLVALHFSLKVLPSLGHESPFLLSYTTNFAAVYSNSYQGASVGHLWSLSVEEQFYLVWPLLIHLFNKRSFQALCVTLTFISLGARLAVAALPALVNNRPFLAANVLTPFQMDAFAIGALLATISLPTLKAWLPVAWILPLVSIASGYASEAGQPFHPLAIFTWLMPAHYEYAWGYSAINLAGGSLIALALSSPGAARVLGTAGLVYLGKISYSTYMLHVIVLDVFRLMIPQPSRSLRLLVGLPIYLGVVFLLSHFSFKYVERPFLRYRDRRHPAPTMARQTA
jgi:peptidoglycan/LPS O-acetylase OafA/YrhL